MMRRDEAWLCFGWGAALVGRDHCGDGESLGEDDDQIFVDFEKLGGEDG